MSGSAEWDRIREASRVRQERELEARAMAQRELALNATPETLRHRQACVIDEMMNRNVLTPEQHRAGQEIAALWVKITAGLFAKVQRYDREIRGAAHHDWKAGMVTAYHERYVPWRDEAGRVPVKAITLADLVFLVVVDNYGARQVADSHQMDQRTVKRLVRESLHRYAEIGGWVDHCGRVKEVA